MFPEIYRWEDGSTVHVSAVGVDSYWSPNPICGATLLFRWSEEVLRECPEWVPDDMAFQVRFSPSGDQPWHLSYATGGLHRHQAVVRAARSGVLERGKLLPFSKRLAGFADDLHARQINDIPGFFFDNWDTPLPLTPFCRFIDQDRWASRFTEMEEGPEPLLGILRGYWMDVMREGRSGRDWVIKFTSRGTGGITLSGPSKEEVIDGFLRHRAMIRPVSEEAGWRQANLIHGRWIRPDPSSIALYDALGEPVPIVWRAPELHQWFLDQGFDLDYEEP